MIQSLRRGLEILEYIARDGGQATVKDTARHLGVDASTASRLMATLERQGFLQQDPKTLAYWLGTRILELNNALLRTYRLGAYSHEVVQSLARETGEASHLAVLVNGEAVFVDRAVGRGVITVNTEIGARDPTYCTAIGRALLSGLSDDEVRMELKDTAFKRLTPKTTTTMDELLEKLEVVRAKGYAFDDEEANPGVQCLAAPVFDHSGRMIAAVGLSGPTASIEKATVSKLSKRVLSASRVLSAQLGHVRNSDGARAAAKR
jgi:DNA-binding IclR family transcriptional regulator